MKPAYVFHLNKVFFDMIERHEKYCEYRPMTKKYTKIPLIKNGEIIRFDLGYSSLKDTSKHLFKKVTMTTTRPLHELPHYVKELYKDHSLYELFHVVEFCDI